MLQEDEHDRRESNHPEQTIPIHGAGSHIRSPVARIYKTDSDKKSWADILENFKGAQSRRVFLGISIPKHTLIVFDFDLYAITNL